MIWRSLFIIRAPDLSLAIISRWDAGRGIPKAHGILLSGAEDDDIQQYFIQQAFPKEDLVEQILSTLENSDEGMTKPQIMRCVNGTAKKIEAALKFLTAESPAPIVVAQQKPIKYARTANAYQLPHEAIARLSHIKEDEWGVMQAYVHHDGCLMQMLADQLDDPAAAPCGQCAQCAPDKAIATSYSEVTGIAAAEFLEDVLIPIEPRKQVDPFDFPIYQFPRKLRTQNLLHETGRALCQWGEAGWGEVAKSGKKSGRFDPRLAEASARLIRERWKPDPFPAWITYVPSHRHPELVAEFAQCLGG